MSLFGALDISGSGIVADQSWINTTGGNIANADDTVNPSEPVYATQTPVFSPVYSLGEDGVGDGVAVSEVELGSNEGTLEYEPGNPEADKDGDVRVANVDLGSQMVQLIQAQSAYQANANAIEHATEAYQAALQIGK